MHQDEYHRKKLVQYLESLGETRTAGKLILRARDRFLSEMDSDDYLWNWARFHDCCEFLETLRLPDVDKPLNLAPFQLWIIALVYARCEPDQPDIPATKLLMVEAGRGAGKTAFSAALIVYEAISNHKKITVDIASIGVRQAHISTGFAQTFADQIGEPLKNFHAVGRPPVRNEETGSILRVLTDDPDAFHGGSARIAFLDEVAHLKKDTLSMAQTGRAKRADAMVWTMSTPDSDRNRPYYSDRDTAAHDLMQGENDRGVYLLAFNADPDDPITDDPEVLGKANPGMEVGMPGIDGLKFNYRKLVENGDAAQRNRFVREHMCRFDDNISTFIDMDAWDQCAGNCLDIPAGHKAFLGVDLSRGGQGDRCDFTSFTLLSVVDGQYTIKQESWLPDANLKRLEARSRLPLTRWVDQGRVKLYQGNTVEGEQVAKRIYEAHQQFDLIECGVDAWTFPEEIRQVLIDELGVNMVYRGDNRNMSQAVGWAKDAIHSKKIRHPACEVMRAHLKNVELRTSPSGALRPCKNASKSTIDAVISFLLACSAAINNSSERPSMYSGSDIVI